MAKLRASDGALLATFPVGSTPEGILFDGSNIWVANLLSDTVTKLRASDGAPLGTFSAGDGGRDLAFDGDNIWVADYYADSVRMGCQCRREYSYETTALRWRYPANLQGGERIAIRPF